MILAGSGLGGGSTINWGCCLDTPSYVRKEWASEFGIEWVDSPEFEKCLDDVKKEVRGGRGEKRRTYNDMC